MLHHESVLVVLDAPGLHSPGLFSCGSERCGLGQSENGSKVSERNYAALTDSKHGDTRGKLPGSLVVSVSRAPGHAEDYCSLRHRHRYSVGISEQACRLRGLYGGF